MDRKLARLIFGGTLGLMSLLYYCCGGSQGTALDQAAQNKMVKQAKELAGDEKAAADMLNQGH